MSCADFHFAEVSNRLVDLRFPRGYIELYLANGALLRVPVKTVQAIQRLSLRDRQDWQILDGVGFTFQKSDEGFHLRQFGLIV